MSSQISTTKAKEYIDNYRRNLPSGSLKSAWINKDFIDAIIALSQTKTLDGVRIYMAKYTEPVTLGNFSAAADTDTIIIVPTEENGSGSAIDVEDEYYDYAHICPPYCDGDVGA